MIVGNNRKKFGRFQDYLFRDRQGYGPNIHHSKVRNDMIRGDYQKYFKFSDNFYSSSAHTGDNDRPTFTDLERCSFETIGPGYNFTRRFGTKAMRNWFDFFDWEGNYIRKAAVFKSLYKANFFTELLHWATWELTYGTCFLWKIWTANDSKKLKTAPPKTPPLAYKAIPPTYIGPTNTWDSQLLWDDDTKWKFFGGKYNAQEIHPDRIEVLCTRPNPNEWLGYSIHEPMFLSESAYFNLIINGIKMTAKYGNVVVAFEMNVPNPSRKLYQEYEQMVNNMKANFTLILGKDEKVEFLDTKINSGLGEFGDILKQDMAACTGLSLNSTYGLSEGGGLQGAGALIAKQTELESFANYQADIADNIWAMCNKYWDLEDLFLRFRLEAQKTDQARYEEEGMQWDNELRKAQWEAMKLQTLQQAMMLEFAMANPELMLQSQTGIGNQSGGSVSNQSGGNGGANKMLTLNKTPSMQKIQKVNHDFIEQNMNFMNRFKFQPRVIDAKFTDRRLP